MRIKTRLLVLNVLSIVLLVFLPKPNLAGQNTDSLVLARESQHFAFYSTHADIKVLDSLAITLENNYARITNRLGLQMDKKIPVKVFPDLKSFHAALRAPDAPDWVVGTSIGDELMMVSPLNPGSMHTYASLMQVIVHEFVHIAVYHARGDRPMAEYPRWLSEGYACYEAGQISEKTRRSLKAGFAEKAPPTWTQLEKASDTEFGYMRGYELSETIIEFLAATYGMDKLVSLVKEPQHIELIYGLPASDLEQQWIMYVKSF